MNIVGIIAEYNPFHNGHNFHLNKAKELSQCEYSVAVMSGHFTQRGEPAIFNKWQRALIAVKNNIDLLIELPFPFSTSSAENFAFGAIQLLDRLNVIKMVAFGAENSNLTILKKLSEFTFNKEITSLPKTTSSAKAFAQNICPNLEKNLLPNNILAIEYLRALKNISSNIQPLAIQRQYSAHNTQSINNNFTSAGNIRSHLLNNNFQEIKHCLPSESIEIIQDLLEKKNCLPSIESFKSYIFFLLNNYPNTFLKEIVNMEEGLENRFLKASRSSATINELILKTKSKRYLYTRLQRTLIYLLFQLQKIKFKQFKNDGPLYIRVLAFNKNGQKILKLIKEKSSLPIIIKANQFLDEKTFLKRKFNNLQEMLFFDIQSSNIYQLALEEKITFLDFLQSPFFYKE